MPLKAAARGRVPPFIVMDVMTAAAERQRTHGDCLHLEVGQPGTSAPETVLQAARRALQQDRLGYTLAFGVPALREAIVGHYQRFYGVDVPYDGVVVTTGSSAGFTLAFLSAFDAGDRVALAAPGYPAYRNILSALGLEVVEIPCGPETRYQPTTAHLEAMDPRPDGLIIASPSNPTGTMLTPMELAGLERWCRENGVRLISDEIYHGLEFSSERPRATVATSESAVVINSFSKYFSMTGWRLGWMVVPPDLLRSVECLAQNFFISTPTLSQLAGIAAFDATEELEANKAVYAANRRILLDTLPKAGFTDLAPADGAFYIYADIGHLTDDSPEFCARMLAETGIAATPGNDFDPGRGHRTLRFSYAEGTDTIREAAERLLRWQGGRL